MRRVRHRGDRARRCGQNRSVNAWATNQIRTLSVVKSLHPKTVDIKTVSIFIDYLVVSPSAMTSNYLLPQCPTNFDLNLIPV